MSGTGRSVYLSGVPICLGLEGPR